MDSEGRGSSVPNNVVEFPTADDCGDFEPLLEAFEAMIDQIPVSLLRDFEGSRVVIEINDGTVCIEAEDTPEEGEEGTG